MITSDSTSSDYGTPETGHDSVHLVDSSSNPIVTRLHAMVQPIVVDLGLDLYDLEFAGGCLRITVDTPPGSPGGVDVDQLSRVTRLVSRELDHVDPIPGHYTLEVSSPGLERNLRAPRHYSREIGKVVAVRLRQAAQGERRVSGTLVAAGTDTFTVRDEQGTDRIVAYADVDRARTVFVWEAQSKPGGPKKNGRAASETRAAKRPAKQSGASGSTRSPADFEEHIDDALADDDMNEQEDQESAES
ncbi:MAG: ribosome maturation factor RimP [Ilumatobacteraceae bacterium]